MRLIDADALDRKLENYYHGAISDSTLYIYEILRLLYNAPAIDAAPEWVSVKNKLPEKDGKYLVAHKNKRSKSFFIDTALFCKDVEKIEPYDLVEEKNIFYWYDSEYGVYTKEFIQFWMPLPKPPLIRSANSAEGEWCGGQEGAEDEDT